MGDRRGALTILSPSIPQPQVTLAPPAHLQTPGVTQRAASPHPSVPLTSGSKRGDRFLIPPLLLPGAHLSGYTTAEEEEGKHLVPTGRLSNFLCLYGLSQTNAPFSAAMLPCLLRAHWLFERKVCGIKISPKKINFTTNESVDVLAKRNVKISGPFLQPNSNQVFLSVF